MKPNLIFLSVTGGGKSTCCKYLADCHGYYNYHPYWFRKRQLETLYKLPAYYLDTLNGKNDRAPGMKITYQQLMVNEYHFWAENDPYFTTRNTPLELEPVIKRGQPVCIQAIRNIAEVNALFRLDFPYELVILQGRGKAATSDEHYQTIQDMLEAKADVLHYISNTSTIDSLLDSIWILAQDEREEECDVPVEQRQSQKRMSEYILKNP